MFIFGQNKAAFAVISANVRVQSATEWTASVHTLTHVQTCNVTRVQSATEWTASVHTLTHVQTCKVTRVQSALTMMMMMMMMMIVMMTIQKQHFCLKAYRNNDVKWFPPM